MFFIYVFWIIYFKCGKVKLLRFFLLGFESRKWMVGMCVMYVMLKNWYSLYLLLVYVCYYFY